MKIKVSGLTVVGNYGLGYSTCFCTGQNVWIVVFIEWLSVVVEESGSFDIKQSKFKSLIHICTFIIVHCIWATKLLKCYF